MRKTLSISVELAGKEIEIREKEPKDKQDNQNDFMISDILWLV